MLKLLTCGLITIFLTTAVRAQIIGQICEVHFSYDAAGSTVGQGYWCTGGGSESGIAPGVAQQMGAQLNSPQKASLYPNPTSATFTVYFSQGQRGLQVLLLTVDGRVLQRKVVDGSQVDFDLSTLAAGVYAVKVLTAGVPVLYKVVKL